MAEVIIAKDAAEAGRLVALSIRDLVLRKPDAVLGLATGTTPLPVYRALAELFEGERIDVSRVRAFALDEYVGLPKEHPESYHSVIAREVTEPLGLSPGNVHVPDGDPATIQTAGTEYEAAINEAGGIDLQILGIGRTGHIGFNEPGSSLGSRTRIKTLTEQTRADNSRFFGTAEEVPMHCITQGLGTILEARHLALLAFGAAKSDAIAAAVEGPVTASVPGSVIQFHPRATVVLDEESASGLSNLAYYRHTWANRPTWQAI